MLQKEIHLILNFISATTLTQEQFDKKQAHKLFDKLTYKIKCQ